MPLELKIGIGIRSALENLLATIASECGLSYTTWNLRVEFNGQDVESGLPTVVLEGVGSVTHSGLSPDYYIRLMRMRA